MSLLLPGSQPYTQYVYSTTAHPIPMEEQEEGGGGLVAEQCKIKYKHIFGTTAATGKARIAI